MANPSIVDKVTGFLQPIIMESKYELFDVEFVKEGANWYLRIFIDKEGGITVDDCEFVSRRIEVVLDEKDPISQPYILEVSSPGIDRPLKKDSDFERYVGEFIDIKLYKPIDKRKEYQGVLQGLKDGIVTIMDEKNNEIGFNRTDISSCRLSVIF